MRELLHRFNEYPIITFELLIASFFANLLALTSSVYVILILNRYLSYGIDATLITLTSGAILAIVIEFACRRVRLRLAENIGVKRNQQLMTATFGLLTTAKIAALDCYPKRLRRELLTSLDIAETAYNAVNLCVLLDLPFALLFVAVLSLLSPLLGGIALFFVLVILLYTLISQRLLRQHLLKLTETSITRNGLIDTATQVEDTVRIFDHNKHIFNSWMQNTEQVLVQRRKIANKQGFLQTALQSTQAILTITIYAVGATLILNEQLDVGVLISANILAIRALSPISRFAQLGESFVLANQVLTRLKQFASIEVEKKGGTELKQYDGEITCQDISFTYTNREPPLFESLTVHLKKGAVMVVTGNNGVGKTTFVRLLLGLLEPERGQILIDGIDLRQLNLGWWRQQVTYLPQEPIFLNTSIRDNILAANANLSEIQLIQLMAQVGLSKFIDQSPDGLDTLLHNQGMHLSLGQRKRLALARALAVNGQLVIVDEPTEGLDQAGRTVIYTLLLELSRKGHSIIICSQDSNLLRGANIIIDLNSKPVPTISNHNI